MATFNPATAALLLIDIQEGFEIGTYPQARSNPSFESKTTSLLAAFRSALPADNIFHIAHNSTNPASNLHPSNGKTSFQSFVAPLPNEPIYTKNVNSAFVGTPLEAELRKRRIERLYVCGLTTDQCVSTTVRMANNLHVLSGSGEGDDLKVKEGIILVRDATATHAAGTFDAETVQRVHEATLAKEFCTVVDTKEAVRQAESMRAK
ncbi:MAG: hypothetical protein MMC23_001682 [Stictis urceolatum]|nr:hypothetical protein [Stictis urceolata]